MVTVVSINLFKQLLLNGNSNIDMRSGRSAKVGN